jgi:hypothetical protein
MFATSGESGDACGVPASIADTTPPSTPRPNPHQFVATLEHRRAVTHLHLSVDHGDRAGPLRCWRIALAPVLPSRCRVSEFSGSRRSSLSEQ